MNQKAVSNADSAFAPSWRVVVVGRSKHVGGEGYCAAEISAIFMIERSKTR